MPHFVSHWLAGDNLVRSLDRTHQDLVNNNRTAFDLGVQGPDFLYVSYASNGTQLLSHMGTVMHSEPANPAFLCMQDIALHDKEHREFLTAYIAGALSHYHLDATIHPYVGAHVSKGASHTKIEAEIDVAMYKHQTGHDVQNFKVFQHYERDARAYLPVARMYQTLLKEIHNEYFSKKDLLDSMKYLNFFHNIFNTKSNFKYGLCKGAMKLARLNPEYLSYFKRPTTLDANEVAPLFDQTTRASTPETNQLLTSLKHGAAFAIDDSLGYQNGL